MRAFEINSYTTMTPILTATQENEGVGTVSQVKIRQKNRTTKTLNIAVFRVFNHPCYYYEPKGQGFESLRAHQLSGSGSTW